MTERANLLQVPVEIQYLPGKVLVILRVQDLVNVVVPEVLDYLHSDDLEVGAMMTDEHGYAVEITAAKSRPAPELVEAALQAAKAWRRH